MKVQHSGVMVAIFCLSACSISNISSSNITDGIAPKPNDLQINHFVGYIEAIPAKSDQIEIIVKPGSKLATIVTNEGNSKIVEGALKGISRIECYSNDNDKRIKINGKEYNDSDLPRIQIAIPANKSVGIWKSALNGALGDVKAADFEFVGCGKFSVGNINDYASIKVDGSNDFNANIISGSLSTAINGSGDIRIAENLKPASFYINGSGDTQILKQSSDINFRVNGSGDLDIKSGGGHVKVSVDGSGDINHYGFMDSPQININGSGDVNVHEIRGTPKISISGSGRFNVK